MSRSDSIRTPRAAPAFIHRILRWWSGGESLTPHRSRAIDSLRAVAILLVIGCHCVVPPSDGGVFAPLAGAWYRVGWAGVDLFFVLSGYLVSGLLFAEYRRTGAIDVRRFLVRRSLKIWPAYFAYLAFLAFWFTWQRWHGKPIEIFASLRANLLHLQNYLGTPREHTWSLAVEEHFYLGLALLAALALGSPALRRHARRFFLPAALATLGGLALLRHAQFTAMGREAMNLYATHLRFDGLLVGVVLAYLHHFRPASLAVVRQRPLATIAVGTALALPWMVATPDVSAWTAGPGLTLMYVGFALVVIGCVHFELTAWGRRVFAGGPAVGFAAVGFYSYGIYLWHIDLVQTPMKKIAGLLVGTSLPSSVIWGACTLAYVAGAVVAGALMSRLIEIPVLAWRQRHFGMKPARPLTPPAEAPAPLHPALAPAPVR
jgi:peptidoglycan/LPS O-acetylase OafA/YrhL